MSDLTFSDDIRRLTGCDVVTVLFYDQARGLARRLFSSRPEQFAADGAKPLAGAAWAEFVIRNGQPLISDGSDTIEKVFQDHEAIIALGIKGIVNFPILEDGRCLGSVNCLYLDRPGHPDQQTASAVSTLGRAFLAKSEMSLAE